MRLLVHLPHQGKLLALSGGRWSPIIGRSKRLHSLGRHTRGHAIAAAKSTPRAGNRDVETLIFDLDGTLYPNDNGYVAHIRGNAETYMHEQLGIPLEDVGPVRKKALALANQTVRGLKMQGYEFDKREFMEYMRRGEELYMAPDPEVQEFLGSLSQPMWIFTNTSEGSAKRALELLGIAEHFEGVLGADFMGDMSKPQVEAFSMVLDHIGADPATAVMFEDSLKNINACKELGMGTVFVTGDDPEQGLSEVAALGGGGGVPEIPSADAVVSKCSKQELSVAMPWLWGLS